MLDYLLRNGTIVDGTGAPAFMGDVGIAGDQIALVGNGSEAQARETIDVSGKIVCPGFIDPHSHADLSLYRENQKELLEPLVRQGITTFIGGNCGMAMAPVNGAHRDAVETYITIFTQVDFEKDVKWRTLGDYMDYVESRGLLLNAGILAPHGVIRLNVMGMEARPATADETEQMARLLAEALEAGALGLSTGLQYMPGSQSDTDELLRLGRELKRRGGIFTSHLRSYSNTLDRAIAEIIEVAEANDIPAQLSHLFWVPDYGMFAPLIQGIIRGLARLSKWWVVPLPLDAYMAKRLEEMMEARKRGVNVRADIMPTTTGFTHVLAFFPPWATEGTREDVLARLKDPEQRRRIRYSIEHGKMTWPHTGPDAWTLNLFRLMGWGCARIMSVATKANRRYEGMSLADIARERGVHPFDACCDLLLEEGGHVLVFESIAEPDDAFTEQSTFAGLAHPEVMISTDAILMGEGRPSRLFYACYPRFLSRYVREKQLCPLELGIRKITGLAADQFNLTNRGVIREKAYADITVFDLETIGSRATFEDPAHFPDGIEHVFINGQHVLCDGVLHIALNAGRLLRRVA